MEELFQQFPVWIWPTILCLAIWDGVWKLIALWKSARRRQLAWFVCIAIFNTAGILPIVYLLTHKGQREND
ncbi:MAG: DUF5652 family protein [Alistipes sp.]|nr:DUF5652 family protein [Alistipes sp.]